MAIVPDRDRAERIADLRDLIVVLNEHLTQARKQMREAKTGLSFSLGVQRCRQLNERIDKMRAELFDLLDIPGSE